ncbi:uncharacterized protein LOC113777167 [Coffea eugenioides]|uniref:uncharacterized protein LOC113777167 n=1 Tax=Coffea eugenioides TaxID=49369 RepID=UPI000F60DD7A|nr:uncharacterized protein LOC113777167 [Coffea eugenioides]
MEEFNESMFRCGLSAMDFDGSKFTWTNGSLWQRLDRALTNGRWMEAYPVSRVSHLARGCSDHAPLLVKCTPRMGASSLASFRFLNVWARHPGFLAVVSETWGTEVSGVGMTRFFNKLTQVRNRLRQWSRETFGDIASRVKEAEGVYRQWEEEYDRNRDDTSRTLLNEARAVYTRELGIECEFWRQKSAIKWLREGDANTSFFHSVVRQRRNSNFIARIKDAKGRWCDTGQHIKDSATDFFARLFTSDSAFRGSFPALPFEVPQVDSACNDNLKAALTVEEVREAVFAMEVNSAPGPDGFGVGFYQICWKIVQDDLVEAVQDFFKGVGQPRVLVNGEPAGHFKSSRGVRQGDPLSPALFLFVAEFLGRGIHDLFLAKESRFFASAGSRVPYLAFVDDILVFTRCSAEALAAIKQFLWQYQTWSGQKVNVEKSSFTPASGMAMEQIQLVQSILGFRQLGLPFRYLGVSLVKGRLSCVTFDGLLAKVRQRLFHWSSKLLSRGGKIILIRHVLSSIPLHLLQVVQPPKAVTIALRRICNTFLWDHSTTEQRVHWAAWEKVCFPVGEGGLGFRSFEDMIKAFSCKLWWKLRKKDSAWAEFMHYKYIRGRHPALVDVDRPPFPGGAWQKSGSMQRGGFFGVWERAWCIFGRIDAATNFPTFEGPNGLGGVCLWGLHGLSGGGGPAPEREFLYGE